MTGRPAKAGCSRSRRVVRHGIARVELPGGGRQRLERFDDTAREHQGAEREDAGLLAVNSFWLSGCGAARAEAAHDAVLDERFVAPALAEDWAAWSAAWTEFDASLALPSLARLTLCGERSALTLAPAALSAWQRVARAFQPKRLARELVATL